MDLSFAQNDESYDTPESKPWGETSPDETVRPYGQDAGLGGFYVERGNMVGRTDTRWNASPGGDYQDTASFASYGDTAPVVDSTSGLGGERCSFSGTLSQSDLAS